MYLSNDGSRDARIGRVDMSSLTATRDALNAQQAEPEEQSADLHQARRSCVPLGQADKITA